MCGRQAGLTRLSDPVSPKPTPEGKAIKFRTRSFEAEHANITNTAPSWEPWGKSTLRHDEGNQRFSQREETRFELGGAGTVYAGAHLKIHRRRSRACEPDLESEVKLETAGAVRSAAQTSQLRRRK